MDDYYIIWTVTALICNINVVVDSTMPRTILFTCVGTPNVGEVQGIWCKGASWWGNTPLTLLGAREIPVVIMAANSAPVHRLSTIINIIVLTLHCPLWLWLHQYFCQQWNMVSPWGRGSATLVYLRISSSFTSPTNPWLSSFLPSIPDKDNQSWHFYTTPFQLLEYQLWWWGGGCIWYSREIGVCPPCWRAHPL